MDNKNQSKAFMVLLMAAFIDVLGFSLIIPILPFWVTSLGGNEIVFGILLSVYSIFQFVFAPVWGKISDKIGRRPVILTGLFGSVISFFLLVIVALYFNSIEGIFIARMFEGIFTSATLPTAYAFIGDISSNKEKTTRFGYIGAMAGMGLTFGPFIGGITKILGIVIIPSTNGYWAPALFASVLALVNFGLGLLYLSESRVENKKIDVKEANRSFLTIMIGSPVILISVLILGTVNLTFSNMESILALFGIERISGFSEMDTGILFLLVGIVLIITQGFLVGKLSQRFTDRQILISGLILLASGFYLAIFTHSLGYMLFVAFPISIGMSLVSPSAISLISKNVPVDKQGQLMGINESLGASMRIIGPLIGTGLFALDLTFPWLFGSIILILTLIIFVSYTFIANKHNLIKMDLPSVTN